MTIYSTNQEFRVRVHDAGTLVPLDGTVDFTLAAMGDYPQWGGQAVKLRKSVV